MTEFLNAPHRALFARGCAVVLLAGAGVAFASTVAGARAGAEGAEASAPNKGGARANASTSGAGDEWLPTADGSQVIDRRSGLVWSRCVEGMVWSGSTCTGQALLLSRADATALAQQRWKAQGVDWRLPRVPELQRLSDRMRAQPLFPAAPPGWHWSATTNVGGRSANAYNYNTITSEERGNPSKQMAMINGWAVNLSTGEARGDAARVSKMPVRLVRSFNASKDLAP